jgi:predicted nucleic acid-binding Zn ribbon protein
MSLLPGRAGSEARPFGQIARELLKHKRFHEKGRFGPLSDEWQALVGDEWAARTKISAFKEGVLVVEVDSPVLLHEMTGFLRGQLLAGLQASAAGRDVVDLRLKLGSVPQ